MKNFLIVYATTEGQTAKIAEAIGNELIPMGVGVEIVNINSVQSNLNLERYDGVMVGASVHLSHFPSLLKDWVRANASALSRVNSAFFSVCLGILEKDNPAAQAAENKLVSDFFKETDWHPQHWTIFAGALKYSKYNWLKKMALKVIAGRAGASTDTSKDYEYTDWNAVKKFALESVTPGSPI